MALRDTDEEAAASGATNKRRMIEACSSRLYKPFDLLPDEVVLKILSFVTLPDLAFTMWTKLGNRKIRSLCQDYNLCKLIFLQKSWSLQVARKILRMAGPHMKVLMLEESDDANKIASLALARSSQLQWMAFDQSALSSDLMKAIGKSSSLNEVYLTATATQQIKKHSFLSAATFISNVPYLKNLTTLFFNDAIYFDDWSADFFTRIADNCRNLECLHFPYLLSLNDDVFNYLLDKVKKTLKGLGVHSEMLTDSSICNLKSCHLLDTLVLYSAKQLGREELLTITSLSGLVYLKISEASAVTGQDIAEAFTTGKSAGHLTTLLLARCTKLDDISLDVIAMCCPNLKILATVDCPQIGDKGVRSVLHRCRKLVELWLIGTNVTEKVFMGSNNNSLKQLFVNDDLVMKLANIKPHCHISGESLEYYNHSELRRFLLKRLRLS